MPDPHPNPTTWFARFLLPILAIILALGSLPASAEALTESRIQSFIASLTAAEALEPELEALTDEMEADKEAPDFSRLFSDIVQQMKGRPVYSRLEDIAQDHGFSNMEEWSTTGDRIFRAWMAIELQEQNPQAQREIAEAMAEIENSPHMTETQKAQMRAMMEGAMGAMESAKNAPPADVEAIRPHLDELRAFSEAE
ncbi:hypothetical protein [Marinobacter similis]|uniref:Uncharacterized protein n=1 Tax=Marinobacter similis TaxID=1420916 RepID=W5YL05_9GAMM|nr:hypothetical protein [Marinobacter similis]AHI29549.1 hypothetical protein AU14_16130 [Marinobacter similis]